MKKVLVGMSGGVDSSATALMLKEQGYEVTGVHFNMFCDKDPLFNKSEKSAADARAMAEKIGCGYVALDIQNEFYQKVIKNFIDVYLSGKTPNPCVGCNETVKLEYLVQYADEHGFDNVSTGHYVKIEHNDSTGRWNIRRAKYLPKDQSYYLNRLKQRHLERFITPLGEFSKTEVKDYARSKGLEVADKAESQEICFIADDDYRRFLNDNIPPGKIKPGNIVSLQGKVLGKHIGIPFYTIGQRKGLNISHTEPLYVIRFNVEKNEVIVGERKDTLCYSLTAENMNWITFESMPEKFECTAQVRYRQIPVNVEVMKIGDDKVRVKFLEPLTSASPGQAVVFYDNDLCIGGGWISEI